MRRKRKTRLRRLTMTEVSLTPLIDTALTLLVIFMITAPMAQHSIKVTLPQGHSKEVTDKQELVISIHKDGKTYFNSYPVERGALVDSVKKALVQKEDVPVYVRADEGLSYGRVIEIVDELKQAGVRYVALSTRSIS